MKNKIEDLRNHLFVTIESLLDPNKPMELDRAKAIAEVAQVMINSAKVEVDMVKALDAANGTGFLQIQQETPK
ncbi:hypothetical protein [Pseudomonas gessardii]|uniref:Phage protein n=1 Tax=Pseudomonas gessardii TaxID=78544 RepID=A0A7Y1QL80_9PSED|nr:hypothetical protein [Pseudomonas gessardii]NNA95835.1 hypothetical protein [Pseudomonas gessardii]